MDLGLKGKIALVTGGAGGIGFGCAQALAQEGVDVIIADINDEAAKAKKTELESSCGVRAWAMNINVMDRDSIAEAFKTIRKEIGTIDILVNNAGGRLERGPMNELTDEAWLSTYDLTIHSAHFMSKEFANQYDKDEMAAIVNVTSKSAIMSSSSGNSHYASAKAAVIGMTRAMAKDFYPQNIRVNCVAPGYVKTEKTYPDGDVRTEEKRQLLLTKRFATPEDLGSVVAFLCSEKAGQVIGAVIDVTGGTLI